LIRLNAQVADRPIPANEFRQSPRSVPVNHQDHRPPAAAAQALFVEQAKQTPGRVPDTRINL